MRLFVVRHAEAAPGEPDDLRPLTDAGRAAARALGDALGPSGVEAVISSPLLRARETAQAIAHAAGVEPRSDERLAPGAHATHVVEAVSGLGETVVAVGHQPDCSQIVLELAGEVVDFAPADVHEVEL